jgi:hypothetical protein
VAQTAKGGQMTVCDPSVDERFREGIGVELGIRPRARDRAHIDEQIDRSLPLEHLPPLWGPDFFSNVILFA